MDEQLTVKIDPEIKTAIKHRNHITGMICITKNNHADFSNHNRENGDASLYNVKRKTIRRHQRKGRNIK